MVHLKHLWKGLPTIIFNQNASYTLGVPPKFYKKDDISSFLTSYRDPDIVQILCVSSYDVSYLSSLLGLPPSSFSLIYNSIDNLFQPSDLKVNQICYMPRKNYYLQQVFFSFLRQYPESTTFRFVPLHNVSHEVVATELRKSVCFLNFGFPEGFGLPIAESIACMSCVVGFNQLGSRDIYDLVSDLDVYFPAQYGDHLSFFNAFKSFVDSYSYRRDELFLGLKSASSIVRSAYSSHSMRKSVASAFLKIENLLAE